MEWWSAAGSCNRDALGCSSSYVGWSVTIHTALGGRPTERRMTGETVRRKFRVSRHQRTRADHCARLDKCEPDDDSQQAGRCDHDPAGHRGQHRLCPTLDQWSPWGSVWRPALYWIGARFKLSIARAWPFPRNAHLLPRAKSCLRLGPQRTIGDRDERFVFLHITLHHRCDMHRRDDLGLNAPNRLNTARTLVCPEGRDGKETFDCARTAALTGSPRLFC